MEEKYVGTSTWRASSEHMKRLYALTSDELK